MFPLESSKIQAAKTAYLSWLKGFKEAAHNCTHEEDENNQIFRFLFAKRKDKIAL